MGKVYSLLLRPIRTFNIENRAERVISKEKPTPSPQYPSVKKQIEIVNKVKPDFMKVHYQKDPQLHEYLKNVYVQSIDLKSTPKEEMISAESLPQDSNGSPLNNNEYCETLMVTDDKCTLQNVMHFISMHSENPTEYSVEKISEIYKLDKQIVENIIMNFKLFHLIKSKEADQLKLIYKEEEKKN
ncbi:Protein NDUFAF4 like protein [Eufriesea mexicana]|uniref:Protein NDUFAF4 like protein n=1 Tax=Eufriesea mexicana TaxID=516756 RepID=A0A310SK84_9HYME|nr:PREDICTED: protein NDUFAF4 homolog [Eufriesea mexicana]OAD54626.1 Protein NDUFAF4 like protein [Eufriesea mexicana]